jgi:hypothetical protein
LPVFAIPTFAQQPGTGATQASTVISGKSMTINVEPGQKINIHLLPETGNFNPMAASYEVVSVPKVGKITAIGKQIGVVSYTAAPAGWSQDSFEFIIKSKDRVKSTPAKITIIPSKPHQEGALVAENITARFLGPVSVEGLSPLLKSIALANHIQIKLIGTSSTGDFRNLSFKIIKNPKYGHI